MLSIKNILYKIEQYGRGYFEATSIKRDNLIYIASFPKSGNTWFRFIVSNVLMLQLKSDKSVDFHTIREYAPEARYDRSLKRGIIEHEYPVFVKTHFPYTPFADGIKAVLVVRNPLPTMISYYEYLTKEQGLNLPPFSDFIRHWRYGMPAWVNFHKSWSKHHHYLLRYEDLSTNPAHHLKIMYKTLGYNVNDEIIKASLEKSSRDEMKRVLAEYGDPHNKNKSYEFVASSSNKRPQVASEEDILYIKNTSNEINSLFQ